MRIVLARRPAGEPRLEDFRIERELLRELGEGELLLATRYLSLDPYMRGRMSAAKSYAPPIELGHTIVGETVCQVLESRHPAFAAGDWVCSFNGWQTHAISDGRGLRKLDPEAAPVSYALGVLGMPGQTAYCALLELGHPEPGQTVLVSAASGAVGSVAGQIAKRRGCRVVGVAGSDEKCSYVVGELGFDACINRRTEDLNDALTRTCPQGVDVYFDNTAGAILEAALRHINLGARIALVGLIEHYNATEPPRGPFLGPLLVNRATIAGFLVSDHEAHFPAFLRDVTAWLRQGELRYREDIVEGLENAPRAFIGLLRGENFGKLIVRT